MLESIKDPLNWTDPDILVQLLRERPSVRGMVYGFLAEVQFAHWLDQNGIPVETHTVDDDHAKTKSDRTIPYKGRRYTIQVKSMQTNSIRLSERGYTAGIQCDGSDRRTVRLPNGHDITTTNYVAGEFMILATPLHPFERKWDFAFRLNSTLPRTTSRKYPEEDWPYLLKTMVPITWPLQEPWTTDLLALLDGAPDLGEVIEHDHETAVRLPGSDETARVIE
ncbi:MAG: hypothetical protein ACLQBY_17095 [Solirubrobacteraceae bacterium]